MLDLLSSYFPYLVSEPTTITDLAPARQEIIGVNAYALLAHSVKIFRLDKSRLRFSEIN